MAFTEYGKKLQRQDVTAHVEKVKITLKDQPVPVELPGERVDYPEGKDANPIKAVVVATGAEIGIGNIVKSIQLVDATDILFEQTFTQENVCVTDQDTFTFTMLIGN